METPRIMIVDDDLCMRQLIRDSLSGTKWSFRLCEDSREAMALLGAEKFDIVITDLMMPHHDGIQVLERSLESNHDCMVILITGYGSVESAVEAIKKGAYDYLQKPFDPDELLLVVKRAAKHFDLLSENRVLRRQVGKFRDDDLIGDSPGMRALKEMITQVAPYDATVLIQGETGTGKELVAKQIHRQSRRRERVFLPVNCGALPESLLESEMFGYTKEAFTGANRDKEGIFETVDQGAIFLDEIDSTTFGFQVNLLRVLQEGTFLKVGGRVPHRVDVRVIAAASQPLEQEVEAGRFRRDLLYRLNVITLELPPLRERGEDLSLLAHHFLAKYAAKYAKGITGISPCALDLLHGYRWPGNVRELENIIERAVIMGNDGELQPRHLQHLKGAATGSESATALTSLVELERRAIIQTLEHTGGHRGRSADILGISPVSLWRKIKKYQLVG